MRYAFIRDQARNYPVIVMCDVLDVSVSGYYDWRNRTPSQTQLNRDALANEIQSIHAEMKWRYGSPRIHAELKARGHNCNVKTVARIMKSLGIAASVPTKYRRTTDSDHLHPVAPNLVNQSFESRKENDLWLTDITYLWTEQGWLYLAAVLDLYSRRIVGWSMGTTLESRLVVNALEMAIQRRLPGPKLMAHSDRGCQYASKHYQNLLKQHQITCSMSRRGNCYDNAPMESFFASLKKELIHRMTYRSRDEARSSVFEYIEVFYNHQRRHSALGYLSPAAFERLNKP